MGAHTSTMAVATTVFGMLRPSSVGLHRPNAAPAHHTTSTGRPPSIEMPRYLAPKALDDLNGARLDAQELESLSSLIRRLPGAFTRRSQPRGELIEPFRSLNEMLIMKVGRPDPAPARRAAIAEILRSARVLPLLVRGLEMTALQVIAFSILWHLSSDAFDRRASETRAELLRLDVLTVCLPKVYLAPSARGGGSLPSSEIATVVFDACGVMHNLCTARDHADLLRQTCYPRLTELADGEAAWAGPALRRAASALVAHVDLLLLPAAPSPGAPQRVAAPMAAGEHRPSPAELNAAGWLVGTPREARLAPSTRHLPLQRAPARRTDDGVVALLAQLPTYEYATAPREGATPAAPTEHATPDVTTCAICLENCGRRGAAPPAVPPSLPRRVHRCVASRTPRRTEACRSCPRAATNFAMHSTRPRRHGGVRVPG